jgi:tRNA (guanine-N7-)-methyltransferase
VGKGKLAKFREMETFEHVVQAPFGQIQKSDFYLKGNWASSFFKNNNPIILELGCGKGEYTVEMAEKFPEKNFLGVDIKGARIWKGAKLSAEKYLKNVGFIRTNIEIIAQFFAPGEVDEIWLTFPDPQMKKTNNRLTSTGFISRYKEFLSESGVIHLKTDSNFQYLYTCAVVEQNNFEILTKSDNLYNSDLLNDILSIKTFYEKQWLGRGITIKYIAFRIHKKESYTEPAIKIEKDDYRSFGRSAREIIKNE